MTVSQSCHVCWRRSFKQPHLPRLQIRINTFRRPCSDLEKTDWDKPQDNSGGKETHSSYPCIGFALPSPLPRPPYTPTPLGASHQVASYKEKLPYILFSLSFTLALYCAFSLSLPSFPFSPPPSTTITSVRRGSHT